MKPIMPLLFLLFFNICLAQPGSIDPVFNTTDLGRSNGGSADSTVATSILQTDGKLIIAGDFNSYNGTSCSKIARLNLDGTLDLSFNSDNIAINGDIKAIQLQSDQKIIAAGSFTSINGVPKKYIARFNSDGTLDATFDSSSGANLSIYAFVIQSDGKILIGGDFTSYNGITRNRIARLNNDGSLDASFDPGVGVIFGTGGITRIKSISLQTDGKFIIAGNFTGYNLNDRKYITRINTDGSIDSSFNVGTGFSFQFSTNAFINTTLIQSDGKILVGGNFINYNGTAVKGLTRLNTDGTLDTSFNSGTGITGALYDSKINSIVIKLDGKILIGGDFTSYNATGIKNIALLNTDGSLDSSFNPGIGAAGGNGIDVIKSLLVQPDGKIVLSGYFTTYNTIQRRFVTRLNANGSLDLTLNPGTGADGIVYSSIVQPDGKIIIGGNFTTYNGSAKGRIARLNADGTVDESFAVGLGFSKTENFKSEVWSLALQEDGKILVGGYFDTYNGVISNRLIRLNSDGTLDSTFSVGDFLAPTFFSITKIIVQPNGKILIGGRKNNSSFNSNDLVLRLNTDGTRDASFNFIGGEFGDLGGMVLLPDGKIIISKPYNNGYIKRLNSDGSVDVTFPIDSQIFSICLQPDGKIIVGGRFDQIGGSLIYNIGRLNTDGSLDSSFYPTIELPEIIFTIELQSDGKVLVSGQGIIRRLNSNGSLDNTFYSGFGPTGSQIVDEDNNPFLVPTIYTTAIQTDGNIIIGGDFNAYNGIGRNRVTRLFGDIALGIDSVAAKVNDVKIYPNPVKSILNISISETQNISKLIIMDGTGKIVHTETTALHSINVENLSSGIYFLQVDSNQGTFRTKFCKE